MSATWYTKAGADAQFATQAAVALKADASGLAAVATSGSYADLANTPTIPAAQVQTDWNAASGMGAILNKPTLFSGAYADLTGKPTLGTAAAQDVTAFATAAQGAKADTAVQPAALTGYVPTTRAVNGKPLSGNVTLAASDVGALTQATADGRYATTLQGSKADTAVQPGVLSTVATTGSYTDLSDQPTIPPAQIQSDWDATSGLGTILNKPTIPSTAADVSALPDALGATATANVVVVAHGATAPTGLPDGTVIVELSA